MLIGHSRQLKFLNDLILNKKISQSYIFSGPQGVGKFLVARMFAWSLIEGNSSITDNFQKSQSKENINLDILSPEVIEKKGIVKIKDIDIAKIREAQKNLSLFPMNGKKRVLIIDDAHRLSIAAQNSLLKTLEEPNSSSVIILITHRETKILNTIKSRCQRINFNLVPFEEIREGLRREINGEKLEKITIFSMGKPGEARKILQNQELVLEKENIFREISALSQMSISQKFDLAQEFSKNIPKTISKLEFWIWMIRLQSYKNIKDQKTLNINYSIIKLIEATLNKLKNKSFNSRLILENLFLSL